MWALGCTLLRVYNDATPFPAHDFYKYTTLRKLYPNSKEVRPPAPLGDCVVVFLFDDPLHSLRTLAARFAWTRVAGLHPAVSGWAL